ncbi:MAG: DNA polymerase III subunit chi [Mariprofundaceae bacterium]|nr:DNA polymerase III subunit chi [Mariprofundaceae bacterium]
MQKTEVFFQHLDKPDRIEGIARLLLKRGRVHPSVLVLCPDDLVMTALDERLWTISADSFLAHGIDRQQFEQNAAQPILLSTSIVHDNKAQVLINAGCEVPPDLNGFVHIVDFVDGWDEQLLQMSRARFRSYQQLDMTLTYLKK